MVLWSPPSLVPHNCIWIDYFWQLFQAQTNLFSPHWVKFHEDFAAHLRSYKKNLLDSVCTFNRSPLTRHFLTTIKTNQQWKENPTLFHQHRVLLILISSWPSTGGCLVFSTRDGICFLAKLALLLCKGIQPWTKPKWKENFDITFGIRFAHWKWL